MTRQSCFSFLPFMGCAMPLMFSVLTFPSCKKNDSPAAPLLIQDTITVQNILGKDGLDPNRTGFIDLYDGIAFNQTAAATNSSKIDFAYTYHDGGCPDCRFFENVKQMTTRTYYVEAFSFATSSMIINAEENDSVTIADFESLKTAANVDALWNTKKIAQLGPLAEIAFEGTDKARGRIFAFIDKNGKKGFFKISDYTANVPTGDPAPLTLYVKIQK
jgi:hypothetical protein